jgi:hypothetical protein
LAIAVVLLSGLATLAQPHPARSQRDLYEKRLAAIEEQHAATLANLARNYTAALARAGEALQQRGELEALLEVKAELARFERTKTVPAEEREDAPGGIGPLMARYNRARTEADGRKAEAIVKLTDSYVDYLEGMKKQLTKEGRIQDALLVKSEVDRVSRTELVAGASLAVRPEGAARIPSPGPDDQGVNGAEALVAWNGGRSSALFGPGGRPARTCTLSHEGGNREAAGVLQLAGGRTFVNGLNEKLLQTCKESDQLTLFIRLSSERLDQTGPARILSYSIDGQKRNFSLCQEHDKLVLRLRTTQTGPNGTNPEVVLGRLQAGNAFRIAVTYRPGELRCFVDGQEQSVEQVDGDFSTWEECQLLLGNEWKDDRPWKGRVYQFAVYPYASGEAAAAQLVRD